MLSTTKTVSAAFHLDKEAKRTTGRSRSKYLGRTLDRSLTYRRHIESLRKKSAINDVLWTVTGCLRPTPADNLPILAGIQPAELRRKGATLSLARRAMEPGHLLHSALTCPPSANARRLKPRHPFAPAAQQLIIFSDDNISAAHWADHWWNAEWLDNTTRLRAFIPGTHPPGMTLPRTAWVRLNRLRTGVGSFRSCLYKWRMASPEACECGTEETADHVVLQCPIHRPPYGLHDLTVLDDETIEWLLNTI